MSNFLNYIDPGTGSMIFTIIIGVATAAVFGIRGLMIKLKYKAVGKKVEGNLEKIPVVIFSDSKRYWNVFKGVCEELDRRGIRTEYWTMSPDDPGLSANLANVKAQFIGEGNAAFARLNMMNARLCLATTPGLDVLQWKRSKNVDYYLHIYHDVSDGTTYRMFGIDCYDGVLMSGSVQEEPIRKLEELRHLKAKDLVLCGSTYMDGLLEKKQARAGETCSAGSDVAGEGSEEMCGDGVVAGGGRTILCAPSWGASSILSRYGKEFIQAMVDTGYNVVVRPHPQSLTSEADLLKELQNAFPNVEWNFDNDNFDCLNRSDILISDFSGVVFDFAFIFDRPVICADTDFDGGPYDVAWLDRNPWTIDVVSDFGVKLNQADFPNMKEIIDGVLSSDTYAEGRNRAKGMAWANQGRAAVVAADYITEILARE